MEKFYTMMAMFFAGMYDHDDSEDRGATVVEYALIVALISIAAATLYVTLGTEIKNAFQDAIDAF